MEHIQRLSLTWIRRPKTPRAGMEQVATEPLPLPDRARIRRLAAIHHSQLLASQRARHGVTEISQQQLEALRHFMLELAPEDARTFMDVYTEESSAVERAWLAQQRDYDPSTGMSPTLVRVLLFAVTVFAIVLAIRYAV